MRNVPKNFLLDSNNKKSLCNFFLPTANSPWRKQKLKFTTRWLFASFWFGKINDEVQNHYNNGVNGVVLLSLLLSLNIFHIFFLCSIVDFIQLNVCWVRTSDTYSAYYYAHWVSVFIDNFEQLERRNGLYSQTYKSRTCNFAEITNHGRWILGSVSEISQQQCVTTTLCNCLHKC